MKTKYLSIFIIAFVFQSFVLAQTSHDVILFQNEGKKIQQSVVINFLKQNGFKNSQSIFQNNEKKLLSNRGAILLAQSLKVQLKSESQLQKLKELLQSRFPELKIESNIIQIQSTEVVDPLSGYQWGLKNQGQAQSIDLNSMQVYKLQARVNEDINWVGKKRDKKIIVAVLDTGVDFNHPDLKNIVLRKDSECQALEQFLECVKNSDRKTCEKQWMDLKNPLVDQDKNGYPMDCHGWSVLGGNNQAGIMGQPDFGDDQGHGTHVAGIIAAEAMNGIGVRGVSENVQILPVQVIGKKPNEPIKPQSAVDSPLEEGKPRLTGSLGDFVARGIIYAYLSGAEVMNMSLGWPQANDSAFLREVISFVQKQGVIIVAAAGNDSTQALLRPCAYPGVICVGAHSPDGSMANFSNFGSGVDIVAPGVNILSTYPTDLRPIRFRSRVGYDFLSGTSQATPFVSGAIAEMLAQGIDKNEIYPRLIVGSRPTESKLPILQGPSHLLAEAGKQTQSPYEKFAIGGLLDMKRSFYARPQPLLTLAEKEIIEIPWNRRDARLQMKVQLVNRWQAFDSSQLVLTAEMVKPNIQSIRPEIEKIEATAMYPLQWAQGEVREFLIQMRINDTNDPAKSRIASEMNLSLHAQIGYTLNQQIPVSAEITVDLSSISQDPELVQIPIENMPRVRTQFVPIDEYYDGDFSRRDYYLVNKNGNQWSIWLLRQKAEGGAYSPVGPAKITVLGDQNNLNEVVLARMDMDGDQKSEYILAINEDTSEKKDAKGSPTQFFIFDQSMKVQDQFTYAGEKAPMPFSLNWQKIGKTKRPVWVGFGYKTNKKVSLRDLWENPNQDEDPKLRLYYLDDKNQLQSFDDYQGYQFIDIIEPTLKQKSLGELTFILAKNLGTEAKPSYIYQFANVAFKNGQFSGFKELPFYTENKSYRNLLDTLIGRVYDLSYRDDEYSGTFWFGEGRLTEQRLTLLDYRNFQILDQQLAAQWSHFDSALKVRAAFSGTDRSGAFVLTNSEIQYHDLKSKKVASHSFERYTFFPDSLMSAIYMPLTLRDSQNTKSKIPALFTTESAELSRGVKVLAPVLHSSGSVVELVSPARLRIKSGQGCRTLDAPVFEGQSGAYSFDYYCGDHIQRLKLSF